jgi:hypothetical protein
MAVGYYVTVQDSRAGKLRTRWAAGPYATHEEALAVVEPARKAASTADPWTDFLAWGTSKLEAASLPAGPMNVLLTTPPDLARPPAPAVRL